EDLMSEEVLLAKEIESLNDQVSNLKAAINALQEDTEKKEIAIAKLAREKEKLNLDLLKQIRSNNNLAKQLEDEREFYFKEKEIYCQEMNESECKSEMLKLKQTLNQTLEANYNLSIKFLRMKNTKSCLKTELKTMKLEHEKLQSEYKTKIENLTSDLSDLIQEKLNAPISPSSKKYLQLVKQNSCLVYENLCLQLEVDNLNVQFEKMKLERTKSETNSRLKYIHRTLPAKEDEQNMRKRPQKDPKKVRIQDDETPEKLEKEPKPCSSGTQFAKADKVVKIFERKCVPGVPEIRILNEKEGRRGSSKRNKKYGQPSVTALDKAQNEDNINIINQSPIVLTDPVTSNYQIKIDEHCREKFLNLDSAKLGLFQISGMQSPVTSTVSIPSSLRRSRSSPNIVRGGGTSFHSTNMK
ncbi:hypothetical protein NQ315_010026, partial [Exocentrus adspersus]